MRKSKQLFIRVLMTLFFITVLFSFPTGALAVIFHVYEITDIIPDGSRTNFVGFEGMADGYYNPPTWTEDGVKIEQINGKGNNIWSTYSWGQEGSHSWYPTGGDKGYTRITLVSGADFPAIGFLAGSGNSSYTSLIYALRKDGVIVAQGVIPHTVTAHYVGFSGVSFDEVLLCDSASSSDTVFNGHDNALAIDSIEVGEAGAINKPPGTPALTYPADGSSVNGNSVRLYWQKSTDPEGGAVTYRLQIAADSGFSVNLQEFNVDGNGVIITEAILPFFMLIGWGMINRRKQTFMLLMSVMLLATTFVGCTGSNGPNAPIGDENTISYNVTRLDSGKTYYWRVIAVDDKNETSGPSETRSFTTGGPR